MDKDEAIAEIDSLLERIAPFEDFRNLTKLSEADAQILTNDIEEFAKNLPGEDEERLTSITNPPYGSLYSADIEDFWGQFGDDLGATLKVIKHRLQKNQIVLEVSADEVVIEANTPHSAYVQLRDVVAAAERKLFFVDPYVGSELFPLLTNCRSKVAVRLLTFSKRLPKDLITEVAKFSDEYGLKIEIRCGAADFHDRFLVVDHRLFHSGASFKDLGKRMSVISENQGR